MNTTTPQPKILERLSGTYNPKKHRGEAARIEILGKMDDRHKALLAAGDKQGLIELAGEYLIMGNHGGMPTMSNIILLEAEGL